MNVTGKALWYIESHLNGELPLEAIADSVGVSRFHLCRAFPESTGRPLAAYVRGRRLSEAAKALAAGAPDILGVALDSGYGSHEAFTRAFRQLFGLTPEQVRAQARLDNLTLLEPLRMDQATITPLAPPRLVQGAGLLIFGLSQRYSCDNKAGIPSQWLKFVPDLGSIPGQVGPVSYGVCLNSDDAGNFDYVCGVEVKEFPSGPPEFARLSIPPQTYAVFEHREHISAVAATFAAIWNQGLPDSRHEPTGGPLLERYGPEFDGRTGLGGLEIWVPVKG